MIYKHILGIFCTFALAANPAVSSAVENLSFGVYTSNKPTAMVKQFRPVLNAIEEHMSETLGEEVHIRIQVAQDYKHGVEHLASGKVDFSRFGPASYVEAKRANPDLKILALESKNGQKTANGVICVAKDSPIEDVTGLRGKSFAFGDEQSTIGRYLSQQYLAKNDIYADDLSRYDYLGRHDKVGTHVGAGNYDAGALNESTFKKLVAKGEPIRAIAKFPNVAKPWIARSGLPERILDAMRQALLEMDDPVALKSIKRDGFLPGTDEDYAVIRESIENNNLFFGLKNSEVSVEDTQTVSGTVSQAERLMEDDQVVLDIIESNNSSTDLTAR